MNTLRPLLSVLLAKSKVVVGSKFERTLFVGMCLDYCLAMIRVNVIFSTYGVELETSIRDVEKKI